ncbi:MAG TPA: hypothetical protein VH253_08565 [Phycisphaerae bacterium]|nr:hypothetical protein [Phycisphaerae bacterium]
MSMFRTKLAAEPETAQEFEAAAESRYWEGVELASAGRGYAGACLLGYTAEILLKLAALRLDGLSPATLVKQRLPPARVWMKKHAPGVDAESYHNLLFWMVLIREKRAWQGRPLEAQLDAMFTQRVRRLSGNWWVEMRYRQSRLLDREIHCVYDDVSWMRDRYIELWR